MHIGFDISQTGSGKAGCGYFADALLKAMLELAPQHCYVLFPSFGDFYFDARMFTRKPYKGREVRYGPRHLLRESARVFWTGLKVEASLGTPDIVHSNNFWCPVQLTSSRLIYTFYDMGFAVNPAWTTEANRVGCFDGVFRSAIAADWVVAISEASRKHYLRMFPHFPEARIKVIYPCSRFTDSNAKGQRPKALKNVVSGKFWLNVGTIEPRKNQHCITEAYSRYLLLGGKPYPLVLAGGKGWLMDDFQAYLDDLGITDHIVMTGYVSDSELIWLYRNCYANLYPSFFEGFGLPVLEGMQFGTATLASDSSSLPEVAGDAAILIDPKNIDAWAQAMLHLSRHPMEKLKMSVNSRKRAEQFDWKQSAISLLSLYEEAKSSPKRRNLDDQHRFSE